HLNAHSDFYYEHVYGDKETYHMAWLMLDQAFSMPASRSRRLPLTLCQHDFDGRLLFQHRNRAKWVLLGHNRPIPDFLYEAECLAFIATLKTLWNGQIFHPPARPPEALALERELIRIGRFDYALLSSERRPLELLRGHRIGQGRSPTEQVWSVAPDEAGRFELVLQADHRVTCRLRRDSDGAWRGR